MKKKFCLCYCPSVVEADDDSDLLFPSSTEIVAKETEKKALSSMPKPSFLKHSNKSLHKLPSYSRWKILSYKNFPRLFKAILFQDPLRNIQQLEIELKSNVGWKTDEKCLTKLENHESRKPEMEVEQVNRIPQETVNSVSHESEKSLSSNWTKPNTSSTSTSSSCEQNKRDSCSSLYLIVFALFMTIFLGSILGGCTPTGRENAMKSSESKSKATITESIKLLLT